MLQAQRMVTQAAGSKENIEQARRQAEVIIGAFIEQVGWHVKIVWQERQPPRPLPKAANADGPAPIHRIGELH